MPVDITASNPGMTIEEKLRWEKVRHLHWRGLAAAWEDSLRRARNEIAMLRKVNGQLLAEINRLRQVPVAGTVSAKKSSGGVYLP
jgi:hypothetical protein